MGRLAYLVRVFKRSIWALVAAFFAVGGGLAWLRDEFLSPEWQAKLKMLDYVPAWPVHWWAIAALAMALVALLEGTYREHRDLQRLLQQERSRRENNYRKRDLDLVLRYLKHSSAWAWRQYEQLGNPKFVDELAEFRRAARDDGIRAVGITLHSDEPEEIPQHHWLQNEIDPNTASQERNVWTKPISLVGLRRRPDYGRVFVSVDDIEATWPRATRGFKLRCQLFVGLKRLYFELAPSTWRLRCHRWNTIKDNVRE